MKYYHLAWAIVNENTGKIISVDGVFSVFSEEGKAWEECINLRKLNPDHKLSVRKTKIALPWK